MKINNKNEMFGPMDTFSPNFGYQGFILFFCLGSIVKCTEIDSSICTETPHTKQRILGGKTKTLNSTLNVSSVQDKKQ